MSTDYVDGFLRYDAFPQNTFAARDLPVPVFKRSHEIRGGNTKAVRSIAWSCDGRRVATGTEMKGLRIWEAHPRSGSSHAVTIDPSSSSPLPSSSKTPSPHNGHVAALAWSPTDPKVLVSACKGASGGGVVVVWDVTKPTSPLASFKIGGDILHLAFHPSGHHFAAVCPRSIRDEVFFFRLKDNNWEQRSDVMMGGAGIDIGVEEVNSLRFWLGGDALLSVSNDGSLTAWKYPVEERAALVVPEAKLDIDERPAKKSRLNSPAESPEGAEGAEEAEPEPAVDDGEGREAAESSEGPEADNEKGEEEKTDVEMKIDGPEDAEEGAAPGRVTVPPSAAPSAPGSAAPSAPHTAPASRQPTPPEEREAATAAANEAKIAEKRAEAAADLQRRKHQQLERLYKQVPHVASLLALAVDPLGRFLAVGGQDARVSLLSTSDWSVRRNFDAPTAAIRHTAFSADGELLAVGGDDSCIFVFSVFERTTIAKIPVTGIVNALAWCPTRNVLTYSTNSKSGVVWHMICQE